MPIARLTVGAYMWQRRLVSRGLVSKPLFTRERAVVAGSFAATLELKCLLVRPLLEVAARHQAATLSIYVDDLSFCASGPHPGRTARQLHQVAVSASEAFARICLPLAPEKALVLVNIAEVAAAVAKEAGALAGEMGCSIVKLGVDVPGRRGVRGSIAKRAARLAGARRRSKRIVRTFRAVAAKRKLALQPSCRRPCMVCL